MPVGAPCGWGEGVLGDAMSRAGLACEQEWHESGGGMWEWAWRVVRIM